MRTKIMFALTALIVILLFINLFLNQQAPKTAPLPENPAIENKQAPDEMHWPIGEAPLPRRAITVIEKSGRGNKALPQILDKEDNVQPAPIDKESKREKAKNPASIETTPVSEAGQTSYESEAGITIIDKQPTAEEKEEMKAKGIVIY